MCVCGGGYRQSYLIARDEQAVFIVIPLQVTIMVKKKRRPSIWEDIGGAGEREEGGNDVSVF